MTSNGRIHRVALLVFVLLIFCAATGWPQGYQRRFEASWVFTTATTPLGWTTDDPLGDSSLSSGTLTFPAAKSVETAAPVGRRWVSLGPEGSQAVGVRALAIDPKNPATVYAGTDSGEVFKTIDGGATWSAAYFGIITSYVWALAIDPQNPATVYAAGYGIFKSIDGGNTWNQVKMGLTNPYVLEVYALAVDPQSPSTVYAGTGWAGVFKSTDGGNTWNQVNTGLTSPKWLDVCALAIDPRSPETVYAGTGWGGVFKSIDGGTTWSAASNSMTNLYIRSLAVDPNNPSTVYAGGAEWIAKSTDGGITWTFHYILDIRALAIDPQNPATVYACNSDGIFRSTDGGTSWSGMSAIDAGALAIDPQSPATVYAGSRNGVFRSTDGGTTWSAANHGLTNLNVLSLAIAPQNPATIYAADAGIFKSTDGGTSWSCVNPGLAHALAHPLAVDPQNSATVYAGADSGGILKSSNGGTSWNEANNGITEYVMSLAIDPQNPAIVYAGAFSGGVFKTIDGGTRWSAPNSGLDSSYVWVLAIDPQHPATVYAGSQYGVYRSADEGNTWNSIGLKEVRTLTIDPTDPRTLYAGTVEDGIFKSTDGGNNWNRVNTGLTNMRVMTLVTDPTDPQILYAGTYGGGVFRSTNAGNSWTPINTGLGFPKINALVIDAQSPQNLYAATEGGSVWLYSMSPISSTDIDLAAGGAAEARTAGTTEVTQAGYAKVTMESGEAPYGTAVFSCKQNGVTVSEAGVPASPPTTRARLFIDFRSGVQGHGDAGTVDIDTGIAIVNYGSETANITYTLRNVKGTRIAGGRGTLAAGAHFAKFIDQLKEVATGFNLPPDFPTSTGFGSLEISSDQPLSVVALRETLNQRHDPLVTTTPIADLSQPTATDPIYFPQFVDGGGYTAALILLNTSTAVETGTLQIFDDNGAPLTVNQVGGTADSSFKYSIPVGGLFRFQTDGFPASARAGWVLLTPDTGTSTPVGAGVFSYSSGGILASESGIPAAASTTHARVYVDLSRGHDTGLAIANPASTSASVTIEAYRTDGVTAVGTSQGPLQLPANGHSAKFATELIPGLPAGFTGVLDIMSATPFAALTLRSLNNERNDFLMTTFPIADADRAAPSPVVFPQIADGGGFVTEFILLNAGATSKTTLSFFDNEGRQLAVGR